MLHRRRHCCHWHRHLMRRKRRQSLIGVPAGPLGAALAVSPGHVSLKPSDLYARLVVRRCVEFPGARSGIQFMRIFLLPIQQHILCHFIFRSLYF